MASFAGDSWVLPDDAVDVPYPTPGAPPIPAPPALTNSNPDYHFQLPADAVDVPHPKAIADTPDLNPGVAESDKAGMNLATGLANSVGNLIGTPNSLARLGEFISGKLGYPTDAVSRHLLSPQEINDAIDKSGGLQSPEMAFMPNPTSTDRTPITPYKPETPAGEFAQSVYSTAPLAMIGGGGLPAMIARQAANLGGVGAGEAAKAAFPDSPGIQMMTGLLGAVLGDRTVPTLTGGANAVRTVGGMLAGTDNAVNNSAAKALLKNAGTDKDSLVNQIDQNMPAWTFPAPLNQPLPTTADVTGNRGLRNMTYSDMTRAQAGGDTTYLENAQATNEAQRGAIAAASPAGLPGQVGQARTDLTNAVDALPGGITAQDAGSQFRTGLQSVYDARMQARRDLGSNVFDALDNSPAQISLRPVMDYATEQAAKNAGEVGNAYKAAIGQFRSGTGVTLDTAPFANSVLKGLGDLSGSYPPGSAAQRAVMDVKSRAEQAIFDQDSTIQPARQAYADASRPLDVFDPSHTPGPIASSIQQTRFGGYVTPNDAVVSAFLKSNGSADAIDRLNGVFGDVKSATQPLQDFIASQVKANAVNPDGSVNLAKLQTTVAPYQAVLGKLPFSGVKKQFSDVSSAQQAVDQLTARQNLVDEFTHGLGTKEVDTKGNYVYSQAKFDNFVNANQGELVNAFGQDGADRINQINAQLTAMAQTAKSKQPGTSGTAQLMKTGGHTGGGNMLSYIVGEALGGTMGETVGIMLEPHIGPMGALGAGLVGTAAGALLPYRLNKFNSAVEGVTRQALSDPIYAKALLTKYNAKMPTPAGRRALDYITNHGAGIVAPALAQ